MALSLHDRVNFWRIQHWRRLVLVVQSEMLKALPRRKSNSEAWLQLRELDSRRRSLHRNYQELFKRAAFFCRRCQGMCCRGPYDRFSPIDNLFRGMDPRLNSSPLYRLKMRLRLPGIFRRAVKLLAPGDCTYLGPRGCLLPVEERPMNCMEAACRGLYAILDPDERKTLTKLAHESALIRHRATALQCKARVY